MNLSDIIKNDKDRLFIVDTECFIIFTGSSLDDDKPFIRLGTWEDLPVEIIPLIENIIITEKILGNPAVEQFNINIREVSSNRYIGSESVLKRFVEYQRNFGLDLTNVSLVNVEKDIPELSDKKNLSDKHQFIGVFYNDGNVKILHQGADIFDLKNIYENNLNIASIMEKISQNNKNSQRYNGKGIVITDKNPLFYSKGYFTAFQFPRDCFHYLSNLEIDPAKIREILLPMQNILQLSPLLKFKNERSGKIRLFSTDEEKIELIKRLFKNATVQYQKFADMNYKTGEGITISSYNGTPNIALSFKSDNSERELIIHFLKSPSRIKNILKEQSDGVIISYTAYEQSALLFKSVQKPIIILDDGNPNIKKIINSGFIILHDGIQYEFKSYSSENELLNSVDLKEELLELLKNNNGDEIKKSFESEINNLDPISKINYISLLKMKADSTKDRKLYGVLKSIIQENYISFDRLFNKLDQNLYVELSFINNSAYEIIRKNNSSASEIFIDYYNTESLQKTLLNKEQKTLANRILADRERLMKLIALFYEDKQELSSYGTMKKELKLLEKAIKDRKEVYNIEIFDEDNSIKGKGVRVRKKDEKSSLSQSKDGESKRFKTLAFIILILIIIAFAIFKLLTYKPKFNNILSSSDIKETKNENIVLTVKRVTEEEKDLLKKHNATITDYDIFRYANDVAIKNGYSSLSMSTIKTKNPNWIYPSNVFIMLDGEKVIVQKGDTLWDLSHAKLEKMNADFFKIIEEIEKTPAGTEKAKALITEAEKYSYTSFQKKIIEKLRSNK